MNKILIGVNALLVIAVGYLFFTINNIGTKTEPTKEVEQETKPTTKPIVSVEQVGNIPTGKVAYINIDKLNDESLEINDIANESKRRLNALESSLESLSMKYQKKVEEYQTSAKAGIAPASEMQNKEKEIASIEKEAQDKQIQRENLTMDISDKNAAFQKTVKDFLIKWNKGRYDFIFSYSETVPTLLLGNTSLEITDEVIKLLNEEYKLRKTKK